MKIENRGIYFGANITGGEAGSAGVVCYKVDDGSFRLAVVDSEGKVVNTDGNGKIQTLAFRDLGTEGAEVFLADGKTDPNVKPSQEMIVTVGSHAVIIEGTAKPGIEFNGQRPTHFSSFQLQDGVK